jgi:hypothetical protein
MPLLDVRISSLTNCLEVIFTGKFYFDTVNYLDIICFGGCLRLHLHTEAKRIPSPGVLIATSAMYPVTSTEAHKKAAYMSGIQNSRLNTKCNMHYITWSLASRLINVIQYS